jgi:hypothetical protein
MAAIPAHAQAAADAREAAADAIRRLDLQTELPHGVEPEVASFFSWHLHLPPEIARLLWDGIFCAAICAALYLLYLFLVHGRGDLFARWRRSAKAVGTQAAGSAHGLQASAEVMMTADELARQGRFVEAMHSLLLQSLADMRQRLDEQFADSLTSREILRSSRLPDNGRASLREIIARVEWTYFGHHPAGPADYEACREKFSELSQALHGGAAT